MLVSAIPGAAQAIPVSYSAEQRQAVVAERLAFGLPVDEGTLLKLANGADVGTSEWGIALTAQEEDSLDLARRWTFEYEVGERMLPYVEELSTYAGMYFDQSRGGELVILLTDQDAMVQDEIRTRVPESLGNMSFAAASTSTIALEAAMLQVMSVWKELGLEGKVVVAAIDDRANAVRLEVSSDGYEDAQARLSDIAAGLGVPVVITRAPTGLTTEQHCGSRDDCANPLHAGVRVNSPATCTQGFHIINSAGDEQFLLAGHCSFGDLPNGWSHDGYGFVGSLTSTLYEQHSGPKRDIMRVLMPDSQASSRLYHSQLTTVEGRRQPIQGETACVSLGKTNTIDCGTIADAYLDFPDGDENGVLIIDLARITGIVSQNGDSGSPYYHRVGSTEDVIALGVHSGRDDNGNRYFTRLGFAMNYWEFGVLVDPD